MILGKGAAHNIIIKQKINTRSNTESELVATHDVFPQILWTKYFLEEQHCDVHEHCIMRDNQSSMIWTNLIVGDRANRNVAKAYVNAVNAIATFVCPTPSTNIITNYTILTQYSIKPGL